jgi:hypothetical protein
LHDVSALEVQYWQYIEAFHGALLSCRTNSKQQLQQPLITRKMVFSYSGWPGLFLSFIANGAQRHLTALARRDEEID